MQMSDRATGTARCADYGRTTGGHTVVGELGDGCPFAMVIAYVDGFCVTSLHGAVGSVASTSHHSFTGSATPR